MKKLILLALMTIIMAGCGNQKIANLSDYKGAVVTGNETCFAGVFASKKDALTYKYRLQLKLTCTQSESFGRDYVWIRVTEFDYMMYHLGDTIK